MKHQKAHLGTSLVPGGCKDAILSPEDNPGGLPFLLLLHGGGGDRRFLATMQPLVEEAVHNGWIDSMVVLTPSAGKSYYLDYQDGSERCESMIMNELIPQVEADVGIDTDRLLISGVSMGGVGSLCKQLVRKS